MMDVDYLQQSFSLHMQMLTPPWMLEELNPKRGKSLANVAREQLW